MKAGELFSFILIFIYTLFTYLLFVKSTETKQKIIKFLPRKESIQTNNFLIFGLFVLTEWEQVLFESARNPSIVPLNIVGTNVTRPSSSVCPSTVTEIPEWKMAEYLDVLTYFSTDTPLNSKKDNSSKSTISAFTRTSTSPRPFKWIYVKVTEEEWMSSHNALRFKVIYQDFRDVIIQLRRLSKTEQHGGVRERK